MKEIFINPDKKDWPEILQRPVLDSSSLEVKVSAILADVKLNGDAAVKKYTVNFDGVELNELGVTLAEMDEAAQMVSDDLKAAILVAKNNIEKFHLAQVQQAVQIETTPGVLCWRNSVAIQKVGLYIPGGTAPLFSTL
ncbi:MAG: histidinol dehydrogenase, partial [Aquabacterium sp.]|nr:histidinol dehydrogenase [Ferruginibacter sp.]